METITRSRSTTSSPSPRTDPLPMGLGWYDSLLGTDLPANATVAFLLPGPPAFAELVLQIYRQRVSQFRHVLTLCRPLPVTPVSQTTTERDESPGIASDLDSISALDTFTLSQREANFLKPNRWLTSPYLRSHECDAKTASQLANDDFIHVVQTHYPDGWMPDLIALQHPRRLAQHLAPTMRGCREYAAICQSFTMFCRTHGTQGLLLEEANPNDAAILGAFDFGGFPCDWVVEVQHYRDDIYRMMAWKNNMRAEPREVVVRLGGVPTGFQRL